jgi:hypothetical protein
MENIAELQSRGYTEIPHAQLLSEAASEAPYVHALNTWKNGARATRGPKPRPENFPPLTSGYQTLDERRVYSIELNTDGSSQIGGIRPSSNRIHRDGHTWFPTEIGPNERNAIGRWLTENGQGVVEATMTRYSGYYKLENGVLVFSNSGGPGFTKVIMIDDGTSRTLFPAMTQ